VTPAAKAPPLSLEQAAQLLARIAPLDDAILIGGQAVNFWATQYLARVPELLERGPYASKDIDLCADLDFVKKCARRLGDNAKARIAGLDDVPINLGAVRFVDGDGFERQIDFLGEPAGVPLAELVERAANVTLVVDGKDVRFRVMHQLHSLRSRAYNVAYIDGYQSEHGLNQLRAAIICARQYVADLIADQEFVRARNANEDIFNIARWKSGPRVFAQHGIEILKALVIDPALDPKFVTKRYPVMLGQIAAAYKKAVEAQKKRAARRKTK
jgi:hypothetical protein